MAESAWMHTLDATTIALVLIPILVLQLGLMLFALYDLFQEDRRVRATARSCGLDHCLGQPLRPAAVLLRRP